VPMKRYNAESTTGLVRIRAARTPALSRDVVTPAMLVAVATTTAVCCMLLLIILLLFGFSRDAVAVAGLISIAAGASSFLRVVLARLDLYDQWMESTTVEQAPAAPLPTPAGGNTFYISLRPGEDLRLPDEPRPGALVELATAINDGEVTFSERGAGGYGYSRDDWATLRDCFIRRGWAAWKNERDTRQGVALRPAGWAVIRGLASTSSPTLDGDDVRSPVNGTHARTHTRN
jgi:hypothetical protein